MYQQEESGNKAVSSAYLNKSLFRTNSFRMELAKVARERDEARAKNEELQAEIDGLKSKLAASNEAGERAGKPPKGPALFMSSPSPRV